MYNLRKSVCYLVPSSSAPEEATTLPEPEDPAPPDPEEEEEDHDDHDLDTVPSGCLTHPESELPLPLRSPSPPVPWKRCM